MDESKKNVIAGLFAAIVAETHDLEHAERCDVWDQIEEAASMISQAVDAQASEDVGDLGEVSTDGEPAGASLASRLIIARDMLARRADNDVVYGLGTTIRAGIEARMLMAFKHKNLCPLCEGTLVLGGRVEIKCPLDHGKSYESEPEKVKTADVIAYLGGR